MQTHPCSLVAPRPLYPPAQPFNAVTGAGVVACITRDPSPLLAPLQGASGAFLLEPRAFASPSPQPSPPPPWP